jgi:hypothetical protein
MAGNRTTTVIGAKRAATPRSHAGGRESVVKRLARLEAEVRRLKALMASPKTKRATTARRAQMIPNAETIAAMEEARRGKFTGSFATVEELMADLNSDAPD